MYCTHTEKKLTPAQSAVDLKALYPFQEQIVVILQAYIYDRKISCDRDDKHSFNSNMPQKMVVRRMHVLMTCGSKQLDTV